MIYRGFKFGMLLQLAVGPMCLMVFNSSATYGLIVGLSLVLAITLVDLLFITLSGLGVAAIINKNRVKLIIKILGSIILLLFGANMIASIFEITLLPNITFFTNVSKQSIFVQGLLLTASNPLTIIFWSGVFSSQVIENKYTKMQLLYFGIGCILSTLCFLSFVALLGTLISGFLAPIVIQVLNAGVGLMIIYFGIRLLLKKQ